MGQDKVQAEATQDPILEAEPTQDHIVQDPIGDMIMKESNAQQAKPTKKRILEELLVD